MQTIRCEKLYKHYGREGTGVIALNQVDLIIESGDFVSVTGRSGSGKSTLLHLIAGVDRPDSGKVFIDDTDVYSLPEKSLAVLRRKKTGIIYQNYNLIPVLTAEENILIPLMLDRKKADTGYLEEIIALLGLEERRNHLPSELSGGQQQRVAIGRALIGKPSIILADEPTGNLDSRNSRDIIDLLKLSAARYGQTVVLVTHDKDTAAEADRCITIKDGNIVRDRRF